MRGVLIACVAVALAGLGSAAEPVAPTPDPELREAAPPLRRLVVKVRSGQSAVDVEETAARYFGQAEVERLFSPTEDETLARFFRVVAVARDPKASSWDVAYRFEELGRFERVEPDQFDSLMPATERAASSGLCDMDGDRTRSDEAWSLRKIRADTAWNLAPPPGGSRFGEGVSVCHPDTGWSAHLDLDGLDLNRAWNVIDGNADARDPLQGFFPLSPGHGTSTGSVIASRGGVAPASGTTGPGRVTGVAPLATLVPIRSVNSVMQFFDSDVAKAVFHSVQSGCDVISMSLGGRAFYGLEAAVDYAVEQGLIVAAAAGNCVGVVVAPALYEDVIAVAATNAADLPWSGSSSGKAVVVSAPGEDVWRAERDEPSDPNDAVSPSNGTSYATAEVAGAAALWIAYHGRQPIHTAASGDRVQDLFTRLLRASARTPSNWAVDAFGSGIVDAEKLLLTSLSTPAPPAAPPSDAPRSLVLMARMTSREIPELRRALAVMLGGPEDLDAKLERFGPELMEIALRDPEAFYAALDAALEPPEAPDDPRPRAQARSELDLLASETLRSALR